ncbi:hypothetical protein GC176_05770 [bacterium]|nr:hypothetical protein [bacterium]
MADLNGIVTPKSGVAARRGAIAALFVFVLFVVGCSGLTTRRTRSVEVQLRQQRSENEELRRELASTQSALTETQQTVEALRETRNDASGNVTLASGAAVSAGRIDRLRLNTLLSGGLDRDNIPGDELLSALVTPVDTSGTPTRVDGTLSLTAFDYSLPERDQQVGHWEWDTAATAALWLNGFVGAGYRITEAWQTLPRSADIVLHARFVSGGGQQFDATETVTIEAIPAAPVNSAPESR